MMLHHRGSDGARTLLSRKWEECPVRREVGESIESTESVYAGDIGFNYGLLPVNRENGKVPDQGAGTSLIKVFL